MEEQKLTLDSPIEELLEKCKLQKLQDLLTDCLTIGDIGELDVNDERFKDVKVKKILREYVTPQKILSHIFFFFISLSLKLL